MRLNPISPKRIKEVQEDSLQVEEAMQPPKLGKGISRFKSLPLEPGAGIPDILCFPGTTTTLRFMDNSGAPWPILSYVSGNGKAFQVQKAGGETEFASNILIVTPTQSFADSSLAVTLAPDVPVVLMLHASVKNRTPDLLVTFRADAPGPNATAPTVREEKTSLVAEVMLSFLDGIPPDGAQRLPARGELQAWQYKGKCYVRTDKSLIWPAYSSVVRSRGAHDMRVYELPRVSSVVLDVHGKPGRIPLGSPKETTEFERTIRQARTEQLRAN